MILRRIASALRRQDWAAVLIELGTSILERGGYESIKSKGLDLVDRIDAELGGKAKAVAGGAEA